MKASSGKTLISCPSPSAVRMGFPSSIPSLPFFRRGRRWEPSVCPAGASGARGLGFKLQPCHVSHETLAGASLLHASVSQPVNGGLMEAPGGWHELIYLKH